MTETDADLGAWAALPEDFRPAECLTDAWLRGLGANRDAPAEVLISLFDARKKPLVCFLCRDDLPDGVRDAAVVHHSRIVRGMAAESGRLSPEQWRRLLAATADPPFRKALQEVEAEQAARRDERPGAGVRRGVDRAPDSESRPPSGPVEIASMAATVPDITTDDRTYALWWIAALHDDADAMRRLAVSPNLWIRRRPTPDAWAGSPRSQPCAHSAWHPRSSRSSASRWPCGERTCSSPDVARSACSPQRSACPSPCCDAPNSGRPGPPRGPEGDRTAALRVRAPHRRQERPTGASPPGEATGSFRLRTGLRGPSPGPPMP
ncbi:hypothetical protein SAMN02787144_1004256 [Streptomyces atratus]|uniref:Uncharacterized protein n=1 Tax=Streptomyces atratus TaxID=1893 RepID=A0A1K1YF75_STRAR|nr:hypothetical protein SAMN02787144_1004256 [Streptomyces atratus]